mmetsp:Transcript_12782/g.11328  ORF Transcript_12782/g.11328 Transcript_12782/m.11328 type:complete len:112 (-) Transcript_12782:151-486(-)
MRTLGVAKPKTSNIFNRPTSKGWDIKIFIRATEKLKIQRRVITKIPKFLKNRKLFGTWSVSILERRISNNRTSQKRKKSAIITMHFSLNVIWDVNTKTDEIKLSMSKMNWM